MSEQMTYSDEENNLNATNEAIMNIDDVLGLNLAKEEPLKPVKERISRPRYLKEDHLLSVRGVSYVRKNAKQRVRNSIEHKDEYKNLTNLLAFYQIWGHNLFPKARFGDFVEMCATVGKSGRRLKLLRRGYLDEDQCSSRESEYTQDFVPTTRIDGEVRGQLQHTGSDQYDGDFEREFLARMNEVQDQEDVSTYEIRPEPTATIAREKIVKEFQFTSNALLANQGSDDGFDDDDDLFTEISSKPSQPVP